MVSKVDFQAFVNGLPIKYLQCRADGHGPWRAHTTAWDNSAKMYERRRRCGNCGTTKPQYLDSEGFLLHPHGGGGYVYPDGYLAKNVALPRLGEAKASYRLALARHEMGSEPRKRSQRRLKAVET